MSQAVKQHFSQLIAGGFMAAMMALAASNVFAKETPSQQEPAETEQEQAQVEAVWIDVRSWVEYNLDHIDGDKHIHYTDIVDGVTAEIIDKNTPIRVYCAVGGRAGKAQAALTAAGYTDVQNAGGIEDARRVRGLVGD